MKDPEKDEKLHYILGSCAACFTEFIKYLLKALFTLNYGERAKDMLFELLYIILGVVQDKRTLIHDLKETIFKAYAGQSDPETFSSLFDGFSPCMVFNGIGNSTYFRFKKEFGCFMEEFINKYITKEF